MKNSPKCKNRSQRPDFRTSSFAVGTSSAGTLQDPIVIEDSPPCNHFQRLPQLPSHPLMHVFHDDSTSLILGWGRFDSVKWDPLTAKAMCAGWRCPSIVGWLKSCVVWVWVIVLAMT
jgi:hypothetical protein